MRIIVLLALVVTSTQSGLRPPEGSCYGPQAGPELTPERMGALHSLVKPQGGEFAWYDDIPWLSGVQEAREKAAKEGKPLLVWCSADGQPCGAT